MARSRFSRCRMSGRQPADAEEPRAMPGVRILYRVRGQGPFKPVEKFIALAKTHLQERYEHYTRLCDHTADTAWEKQWYERMCNDISATLRTLAVPHISPEVLFEITHNVYGGTAEYPPEMERYAQGIRLFADMEFRQEPDPSGEQLVQLPLATAFCRARGVGDLVVMKPTPPAPRSDERTRQVILAEHKHGYAERRTPQNVPEREQPSPASENHPTMRQGAEPTQEKVIPLFPKRPRLGGGAKGRSLLLDPAGGRE
jgi:hypothetical protein